MNYALAIQYLHPDAEWSMAGNDLSTLEWRSDGDPPTQQELEAAWPAANYEHQMILVDAKRRAAYADEADPLFFKVQRGELDEQVWLDKVDEIRVRFPDPPEVN